MRKLLPFSLLLVLGLLFSACDREKEKEEEPLPAAEVNLQRTILYTASGERKEANYTEEALQSAFMQDGELIRVYFSAAQATGKDHIFFDLDKTRLSSSLIGSYTLKSLPNPDEGVVSTTYTYKFEETKGSMLFSMGNTIEGSFKITAYDNERQLVSGNFTASFKGIYDPTKYYPNLADAPKCDLTITGTFKNMRYVQ